MMIQGSIAVTPLRIEQRSDRGVQNSPNAAMQSPNTDSAHFSQGARQMALVSPAILISEEQIQVKMSLVRTLMETLFGPEESNSLNTESVNAEQEMIQGVIEEPLAQQALLAWTESFKS